MADGWLWLSMRMAAAMPSPTSTTPAFSPGPDQHPLALGRQPLQVDPRRLVGAVLGPHDGEHGQLEVVGLPTEDPFDVGGLVVGQAERAVDRFSHAPNATRGRAGRLARRSARPRPPVGPESTGNDTGADGSSCPWNDASLALIELVWCGPIAPWTTTRVGERRCPTATKQPWRKGGPRVARSGGTSRHSRPTSPSEAESAAPESHARSGWPRSTSSCADADPLQPAAAGPGAPRSPGRARRGRAATSTCRRSRPEFVGVGHGLRRAQGHHLRRVARGRRAQPRC